MKSGPNHGLSKTRLYSIWTSMKTRCCNPNATNYGRYGGRGITICAEWVNDFLAFRSWALANGYRDDLTIDRKNNDGPYSPENCCWKTQKEQAKNRRSNNRISWNGKTHLISEWSEITGINRATILWRLKNGWSIEKALTRKY